LSLHGIKGLKADAQRDHHLGLRGLQAKELQHHQEQKKAFRASQLEEILPVLQQAYGAQGDQIARR
jgi:hypothetical protein